MTNHEDCPPDSTANRRKEVFRTTRGSRLSALRGRLVSDAEIRPVAESGSAAHAAGAQPARHRVNITRLVEDGGQGSDAVFERRYSEPND